MPSRYAAAGNLTCRDFPGSRGHEKLDADTFMSWGADFVKLDACADTGLWKGQYVKVRGIRGDAAAKCRYQVTFLCTCRFSGATR